MDQNLESTTDPTETSENWRGESSMTWEQRLVKRKKRLRQKAARKKNRK
jgi:hypothetical protein